jgi:hypothetical protein
MSEDTEKKPEPIKADAPDTASPQAEKKDAQREQPSFLRRILKPFEEACKYGVRFGP